MNISEETLDRELTEAQMAVLNHTRRERYPALVFFGFLVFLGGIALLLMNGLRNVSELELGMIAIGAYPTWRALKHDSEHRRLKAKVTELEARIRQLNWERVAPPGRR
jgi:hypothetical protein